MKRGTLFVALAVVLLMSSSILAADPFTIKRGIDAFTTTDNGRTFFDFSHNPIPAGFFCKDSAAFTGRVAFKGLPIETAIPGQLRGADTVVERLDDAVFNAQDTAMTRVRFRALSLVSITPLRTACGNFHVYVSLAGEQRVTTMSILRTQEGGGSFVAPLAIDARLTFIPVKPVKGKGSRKLEITQRVTFPADPTPWSLEGGEKARQITSALVDTNGDLAPDTFLNGTGNFWPGWSPAGIKQQVGAICYMVCEPEVCHTDSGEQHCTGPVCTTSRNELCP